MDQQNEEHQGNRQMIDPLLYQQSYVPQRYMPSQMMQQYIQPQDQTQLGDAPIPSSSLIHGLEPSMSHISNYGGINTMGQDHT